MEIDVFCHITPPKYADAMERLNLEGPSVRDHLKEIPTVHDWERRFRIMDRYPGYVQVLTIGTFYQVTYRDEAVELARIANDEMAELVLKYPDRFVAGIAVLPLNDLEAALVEADRAIKDLKLRGVEIWAHRDGKPVDLPEFMPLYEKMSQYNLPLFMHPMRGPAGGDYSCEKESRYRIWRIFGWLY